MTTAKINLEGHGIVVNVAKPRSKIANVYTPKLSVGKPIIKTTVTEIVQDDIEVNIAGILGTGIADPTQFRYNKELFISSEVLSALVDKYRSDEFGSFDYITNFFAEKVVEDSSLTSEEQKFDATKVLLDSYNTSEERKLLVTKVLEDISYVPDELKVFIGKVLLDSSLANEEFTASVEKIRSDNFSNVDLVTILWEVLREFSDNTTTSEETKFDATKILLDNSTSLDTPYKATTKVAMDIGAIDDLIKHVTWFRRTYSEHIYATDDVLGEANIDDDQTAQVIKGLIEPQTTDDISYVDIHTRYRSVVDSVTDVVDLEIGRKMADDLSTMSMLVTKALSNIYIDNYYLFEENKIDVTKVLLDSSSIGSLVELNTTKDLRDAKSIIEVQYIDINKVPTVDTTTMSDSEPIHIVSKVLLESESISEVISKLLSSILPTDIYLASDTISKQFVRPAQDDTFGIQTDYALLHPNKGVAEVNTFSESGYMNKQDYFAQDYVKPGYSGTDYTF